METIAALVYQSIDSSVASLYTRIAPCLLQLCGPIFKPQAHSHLTDAISIPSSLQQTKQLGLIFEVQNL